MAQSNAIASFHILWFTREILSLFDFALNQMSPIQKFFFLACLFSAHFLCSQKTAAQVVAPTLPDDAVVKTKRTFELHPAWRGRGATLYRTEKPEDLYYLIVQDDGKGHWSVSEVGLRPPTTPGPREEVLVLSTRLNTYHPDWQGEGKDKDTAELERLCTNTDESRGMPYRVCNSAFGTLTTGNALLGFLVQSHPNQTGRNVRTKYNFSEANLKKVMAQIDFEKQLQTAEIEGKKYWTIVAAEKAAAVKKDAENAALWTAEQAQKNKQAEADYAAMKMKQETAYALIAKYPVGFKDSCHTPKGYRSSAAPPEDPDLVCQNMGKLSSLKRLKGAGYIVTNVARLGEVHDFVASGWSWQFNVERYSIPK